ncbi:glycosyltransferase family 4 protein [Natranaeroarchaeum sulfidigenes]|uniref:glycosyltransferase family 4 protein n=1 Tax=Natranaeroarchaeum sulfidigenes TaxID=2784880 RepID=UPI002872E051|nr:glycosyltransferase family 4 protein [Natranaeroarchaeum sulfidigenes]
MSHWLYPDEVGGGNYHVHALSRDQASMGHEVTVLKVSNDVDSVRREERNGYEVVYCPATVNLLKNEISIPAVRRILGAREFDVIHAHSHFYFSTNIAALKRRLGDIPLAITNHSLYTQSAPERLFYYYLKTIGKWTFNSADVVFCYTEEERQATREIGVTTDIKVIKNGIDAEKFHPDGAISELIASDVPNVLFVGRLVEGKGPQYAIDAIERVRADHPDARLYLVGDGPLHEELEADVEERGLESAVEFLGLVEYDNMPKVFRTANVLLLPSRAEGFPRVVMEAMASGTPVVCTDLDQIVDFVSGAGETVEWGDVVSMGSALGRILSDPQTQDAYGTNGRETIVNEYSWSETVRATTESLYQLHTESEGT